MVDSATISGIAQSDLSGSVGTISRGTSAPSDSDQLWIDTNLTPPVLKHYDGTNWVPSDQLNLATNNSGVSLSAGNVVIVDTTNSEYVKTTSSAGDQKWRGIAVATVANAALGVFRSHGYVPSVTLEISASAGCGLRTSSATGKAEPVALSTPNVFGIVTTSGTASAGAFLFGNADQGYAPSVSNALSGSVIQVVNSVVTATASGTTTMPLDNSIPQNTEGVEWVTASITPNNTANYLVIFAGVYASYQNTAAAQMALFQDSTANALASHTSSVVADVVAYQALSHYMTAGTVSSTTFKIRSGQNGAGTWRLHANSGGQLLNGSLRTFITILEVKA